MFSVLPIKERRDWHLLKLTYKALYSKIWPSYLKLNPVVHSRTLRSSAAARLTVPLEKGTFQYSVAFIVKGLPEKLRQCKDFKSFTRLTKSFLRDSIFINQGCHQMHAG